MLRYVLLCCFGLVLSAAAPVQEPVVFAGAGMELPPPPETISQCMKSCRMEGYVTGLVPPGAVDTICVQECVRALLQKFAANK